MDTVRVERDSVRDVLRLAVLHEDLETLTGIPGCAEEPAMQKKCICQVIPRQGLSCQQGQEDGDHI